jgi:diacylglycerol O-acyltransferase
MSDGHCERLTALDDSFLELEDPNCHMHIGAAAVFEPGPLASPGGGVDFDRICHLVEASLHHIPRYRQRLGAVPVLGHPVWVDDDRFNLIYHLRHTRLPSPGDVRQLKRLVGRIMSQQLDRGKPLWETWVVEGLEDGAFAVVTKVHHCMIDGVGSVELSGSLMRATAEDPARLSRAVPPWNARPAPSGARMLLGELSHRLAGPGKTLGAARRALGDPVGVAGTMWDVGAGIVEAMAPSVRPASPTPLNVPIGPHRRFDWTAMSLADVKQARRLGGTLNDVVLAVLAGGLRRFLQQRGVGLEQIEFRVMVPVNVRTSETRQDLGNQVSMLVVRLPLVLDDARERLAAVMRETTQVKHSRQGLGTQVIEEVSDWISPTLLVQFGRLAASSRPFNMVVTNVPGPQFPVYLLGATMRACYPLVPLFRNQALGIALFSYDGTLYWGFNSDWDAVPDLHDLVTAVDQEFSTLREAAAAA